MARHHQHVTIIGVGLLGGSIGLALKALHGRDVHVAGVGRSLDSLNAAIKAGAIDSAHLDAAEAAPSTDLVILATPVCTFEHHLRRLAPVLKKSAWVTDVGSTKLAVVKTANRLIGQDRFIGSHPMAGSDVRGVANASADLFAAATCIITPSSKTPPTLRRRASGLWKSLGMKTIEMSPARHDQVVARISHLPHLLSAALMLLPKDDDLAAAAGGFKDMTRISGGDVEMWRGILLTNKQNILAALDAYEKRLRETRRIIAAADVSAIERNLIKAQLRRRLFVNGNLNR
jgi:prephenate dehydrogenase